jgi:hypothetical protein
MKRLRFVPVAAKAFAALAAAPQARSQSGDRDRHGVFTGEIKSVVYVSDVERSMVFYRDVLGFDFLRFAEHDGRAYYAEMLAAQTKFGLHEPLSPSQEDKVGKVRLYFRVRDLDAHHARVAARGGEPGELRRTGRMDMFLVTKDERRPSIADYLEAADFETYRDLIDPIVRVSDDGTLGWLVCQVEIVGTRASADGEEGRIDSVWAWIELYEKMEGRWYRTGNVSNMKPHEN